MANVQTLPMTLTAPCQHNGCPDRALYVVRVVVPVRGHANAAPWDCLAAREVCKAHFGALKVQAFLTKLVRGAAKHQMREAGCDPDFDNARLEPVHIMGAEYRRMKRIERGEASKTDMVLFEMGAR